MHLEFPLTHYTILQTHNIAWRKFHSLFLNIVKKGKGAETQNCPNNSVSHNFCHWLSEKSAKFDVQYFRVAQFESNWRHAFTHYVTIMSALIYFASETNSLISWESEAKLFRSKICKFFLVDRNMWTVNSVFRNKLVKYL